FDQFNLFLGEWAHLLAIDSNYADDFSLFEHRYHQIGPRPRAFDEGHHAGVFSDVGRIDAEVRNVDNLLGHGNAFERNSWIIAEVHHGIAKPRIGVTFRAMDRDRAKDRPFAQEQIAERGLTDAGRVRQHGIEDRL